MYFYLFSNLFIVCSLLSERGHEFYLFSPLFISYYPYGSITSTVIGFSGTDGGLEGAERVFENQISKSQSSQSFIRNRRGEKTFGDLNSFDLSNNKKS